MVANRLAGYCLGVLGCDWLVSIDCACGEFMNRFKRLKALPCCQCGATPVDVAHANWGEFGKGMGKKADDEYTIPLCRACHFDFDTYADMEREKAKAWFLRKLEIVNKAIYEQQSFF